MQGRGSVSRTGRRGASRSNTRSGKGNPAPWPQVESNAVGRSEPRRRLPKGERTAARILDAAEALFAERGYAGTTLREVAEVVGLREPSLYNHFTGKEGLYAAVLERSLSPMREALERLLEDGGSFEDFARLPEIVLNVYADHPNFARLFQHEVLTGREGMHPLLRRWMERIQQLGLRAAGRFMGEEDIDREERSLRLLALINVVVGYATSGPLFELLGEGDLLSERLREKQLRIVRIVLDAFRRTPPRQGGE